MAPTMTALLGYTAKQIRKKIQFVETIGGDVKKVVCLRGECGPVFFDVVEDRPDLLKIRSGRKTLSVLTTTYGRRLGR